MRENQTVAYEMSHVKWSEQDENYILNNYSKTNKELAVVLHRSAGSVKAKRVALRKEHDIPFQKTWKEWLPEEVEELIRLYKKGLTPIEISIELNRSSKSVNMKLHKLRQKNPEALEVHLVRWTEAEERLLYQLLEENKTYEEIGKIMNKPVVKVRQKVYYLRTLWNLDYVEG